MSFLSPLALALLGLTVPLGLLYFVRVVRRDVTIPSLVHWRPGPAPGPS